MVNTNVILTKSLIPLFNWKVADGYYLVIWSYDFQADLKSIDNPYIFSLTRFIINFFDEQSF